MAIIHDAKNENLEYERIAISGKANAEIPKEGVRIGLNYRINMIADSLIWMRISKFGFEAARVLVKNDSIFVIDRVNNQFVVSDLSLAKSYIGMELELDALQDVFLGNFNPVIQASRLKLNAVNGLQSLKGSQAGTYFAWDIDPEMNKLLKITATNPDSMLSSQLVYKKFEKEGKVSIPLEGRVEVKGQTELNFEYNHRKIEVDPQKMSLAFKVPKSFDRVVYE